MQIKEARRRLTAAQVRITGTSIWRGWGLSCVGDKYWAISLGSSRGCALHGNPGTLKWGTLKWGTLKRGTEHEKRNGKRNEERNMKRGTLKWGTPKKGTLKWGTIKRGTLRKVTKNKRNPEQRVIIPEYKLQYMTYLTTIFHAKKVDILNAFFSQFQRGG